MKAKRFLAILICQSFLIEFALMTKLMRTKTLRVSLRQFFKLYLVCPLYLLALSSSFRLISLFGTVKSELAAWLRASCEARQSGATKTPESAESLPLTETLFSEIEPQKIWPKLEPQTTDGKSLDAVLKFLKNISRDSRF